MLDNHVSTPAPTDYVAAVHQYMLDSPTAYMFAPILVYAYQCMSYNSNYTWPLFYYPNRPTYDYIGGQPYVSLTLTIISLAHNYTKVQTLVPYTKVIQYVIIDDAKQSLIVEIIDETIIKE